MNVSSIFTPPTLKDLICPEVYNQIFEENKFGPEIQEIYKNFENMFVVNCENEAKPKNFPILIQKIAQKCQELGIPIKDTLDSHTIGHFYTSNSQDTQIFKKLGLKGEIMSASINESYLKNVSDPDSGSHDKRPKQSKE